MSEDSELVTDAIKDDLNADEAEEPIYKSPPSNRRPLMPSQSSYSTRPIQFAKQTLTKSRITLITPEDGDEMYVQMGSYVAH